MCKRGGEDREKGRRGREKGARAADQGSDGGWGREGEEVERVAGRGSRLTAHGSGTGDCGITESKGFDENAYAVMCKTLMGRRNWCNSVLKSRT